MAKRFWVTRGRCEAGGGFEPLKLYALRGVKSGGKKVEGDLRVAEGA